MSVVDLTPYAGLVAAISARCAEVEAERARSMQTARIGGDAAQESSHLVGDPAMQAVHSGGDLASLIGSEGDIGLIQNAAASQGEQDNGHGKRAGADGSVNGVVTHIEPSQPNEIEPACAIAAGKASGS